MYSLDGLGYLLQKNESKMKGKRIMNIVYVAYCCAPYNGSEASIGWEIPLNASRNNKVFLVTVPESKPFIDRYYAETMGGGASIK